MSKEQKPLTSVEASTGIKVITLAVVVCLLLHGEPDLIDATITFLLNH